LLLLVLIATTGCYWVIEKVLECRGETMNAL